jgi:hypothetical protein
MLREGGRDGHVRRHAPPPMLGARSDVTNTPKASPNRPPPFQSVGVARLTLSPGILNGRRPDRRELRPILPGARGTPIPSYNPRCESSVGGKPPGRANTPWGIETGLMRFTFQMPGSVSWNPSDQVVTCVPISVIPAIALSRSKRPRVKTRNSAFPRRDCWPALVCKSLIRTNSKCAWLRLARINARVASSESAVSPCKY